MVEIRANRLSGTCHDDGFKKLACVAPTREDSGDKRSTKKAGSSLCRMALWQWLFTRIEPKKSRVKNHMGKQLGELLDAEKKTRNSLACQKSSLFQSSLLAVSRVGEGNLTVIKCPSVVPC